MELSKTVPAYSWIYLFIFANTEIYVIQYKTHWIIVKTTFENSSDVSVIKGFTVSKQ